MRFLGRIKRECISQSETYGLRVVIVQRQAYSGIRRMYSSVAPQ
jgi:hypothetical protein